MGDIERLEEVFQGRRLIADRARSKGLLPNNNASGDGVVVHRIELAKIPLPVPAYKQQIVPSNPPVVPRVSKHMLALASMERGAFDLEEIIATIKKESDGGSRTIPKLNALLDTLRTSIATLKKI